MLSEMLSASVEWKLGMKAWNETLEWKLKSLQAG
jgi:hypothetical protein